jgi:hypothetical protein
MAGGQTRKRTLFTGPSWEFISLSWEMGPV